MNEQQAERWVVISAATVAGIYAYRRATEQGTSPLSVKALAGKGSPVAVGAFVTAWGFTFLVVSILATAAPGLGAAFAILIATSDFLSNGQQVLSDVTKQTKQQTSATTSTATASAPTAPLRAAAPATGAKTVAGQTSTSSGQTVANVIGGIL